MDLVLDKEYVGKKVRFIRTHVMHQTQEEFADALGISKDCISKIERGLVLPCTDTLYKLAMMTGEPMDFFLRPLT